MPTHTIQYVASNGGSSVTKSVSTTAGLELNLEESVPDSSSDLELAYMLDVSVCTSFFIVSTQDVTVETNDGSSPDDTLSLTANVPYTWKTGCGGTFELGTDVTALFVTNASGSDATLTVMALQDPTP